ncbi:hypothetical protein CERSUDRAFT_93593 [Gelatoporia subvermispora B]|uniref:Uncharacterized protein n=1 Tax=Ceriporiopsis subvermispora (strain B) TaxID=914234 RepID=M2RGZ0_CERS8|nr:hypothetical protein CERSUDRAFT_93593 [Gelatoporia subvermispora B]
MMQDTPERVSIPSALGLLIMLTVPCSESSKGKICSARHARAAARSILLYQDPALTAAFSHLRHPSCDFAQFDHPRRPGARKHDVTPPPTHPPIPPQPALVTCRRRDTPVTSPSLGWTSLRATQRRYAARGAAGLVTVPDRRMTHRRRSAARPAMTVRCRDTSSRVTITLVTRVAPAAQRGARIIHEQGLVRVTPTFLDSSRQHPRIGAATATVTPANDDRARADGDARALPARQKFSERPRGLAPQARWPGLRPSGRTRRQARRAPGLCSTFPARAGRAAAIGRSGARRTLRACMLLRALHARDGRVGRVSPLHTALASARARKIPRARVYGPSG